MLAISAAMQILWMIFAVFPACLCAFSAFPTSQKTRPGNQENDQEQNEIDHNLLFHAAYITSLWVIRVPYKFQTDHYPKFWLEAEAADSCLALYLSSAAASLSKA